ncbi:selenocysteine-specific elongation factor [Nocardioides mangrovicus]|uniref:Selenocysteine-specific elongation factor n=1 Tax=Nocardioides mangrovicus TaxID=2478913 RepID=A0A3L8P2W0_9ACTN|nr:selenocysteine-specific translation elongation factor [Nocardioides mangrovicus]RLV49645.1 selenocysteine-specific elongation factor [Nocardioides mangrovicus]
MHVVATAGHVDHGKSTLVRALTGAEPDRLPAEQRRGLSIELGYAWTELGGHDVAFVDVPGHERFVATTLAGLGPVPAVMFVVAADDPWMPQAEEHLAALDALGVSHGVLVVTRADLADPGPTLALARRRLAATSLAGVPEVVVSGRTGEGLDRLRSALAGMIPTLAEPDPAAPVRLWLDRAFHVRGTGTVVTGTLQAGTLRVGDRLAWHEEQVRIRGLQSLERPVETVSGVARVALALGGHVPDGLDRESVLVTPGAFGDISVVDVAVAGDPPGRPLLHVGATATSVQVRPLADGYARLRLERPLPLVVGDRVLLRDPGARTVWGVDVLALDPAPLRRRGAAARRAAELADGPFEPPVAVVDEPEQRTPALTPRLSEAAAIIREHLAGFDAPDATTLADLGLDAADLAALGADGELLRLDARTVMLPGSDERAVEVLATLPAPFTTSQARQALGTSRRVVLPLLTYLDRTGRTVRLADDTRRMRAR